MRPNLVNLKNLSLIILVGLLVLVSTFTYAEGNGLKRKVFDLTTWSGKGAYPLDGAWEFYWQKLLTPKDFQHQKPKMTGYFQVPGFWNEQKAGATPLDSEGFATYRTTINLGQINQQLAIQLPRVYTSYKLWMD